MNGEPARRSSCLDILLVGPTQRRSRERAIRQRARDRLWARSALWLGGQVEQIGHFLPAACTNGRPLCRTMRAECPVCGPLFLVERPKREPFLIGLSWSVPQTDCTCWAKMVENGGRDCLCSCPTQCLCIGNYPECAFGRQPADFGLIISASICSNRFSERLRRKFASQYLYLISPNLTGSH